MRQRAAKEPEGNKTEKAKPAVVKCLDAKRSNAVAIMMSSLPPVNDVKLAIVNLDESVL